MKYYVEGKNFSHRKAAVYCFLISYSLIGLQIAFWTTLTLLQFFFTKTFISLVVIEYLGLIANDDIKAKKIVKSKRNEEIADLKLRLNPQKLQLFNESI